MASPFDIASALAGLVTGQPPPEGEPNSGDPDSGKPDSGKPSVPIIGELVLKTDLYLPPGMMIDRRAPATTATSQGGPVSLGLSVPISQGTLVLSRLAGWVKGLLFYDSEGPPYMPDYEPYAIKTNEQGVLQMVGNLQGGWKWPWEDNGQGVTRTYPWLEAGFGTQPFPLVFPVGIKNGVAVCFPADSKTDPQTVADLLFNAGAIDTKLPLTARMNRGFTDMDPATLIAFGDESKQLGGQVCQHPEVTINLPENPLSLVNHLAVGGNFYVGDHFYWPAMNGKPSFAVDLSGGWKSFWAEASLTRYREGYLQPKVEVTTTNPIVLQSVTIGEKRLSVPIVIDKNFSLEAAGTGFSSIEELQETVAGLQSDPETHLPRLLSYARLAGKVLANGNIRIPSLTFTPPNQERQVTLPEIEIVMGLGATGLEGDLKFVPANSPFSRVTGKGEISWDIEAVRIGDRTIALGANGSLSLHTNDRGGYLILSGKVNPRFALAGVEVSNGTLWHDLTVTYESSVIPHETPTQTEAIPVHTFTVNGRLAAEEVYATLPGAVGLFLQRGWVQFDQGQFTLTGDPSDPVIAGGINLFARFTGAEAKIDDTTIKLAHGRIDANVQVAGLLRRPEITAHNQIDVAGSFTAPQGRFAQGKGTFNLWGTARLDGEVQNPAVAADLNFQVNGSGVLQGTRETVAASGRLSIYDIESCDPERGDIRRRSFRVPEINATLDGGMPGVSAHVAIGAGRPTNLNGVTVPAGLSAVADMNGTDIGLLTDAGVNIQISRPHRIHTQLGDFEISGRLVMTPQLINVSPDPSAPRLMVVAGTLNAELRNARIVKLEKGKRIPLMDGQTAKLVDLGNGHFKLIGQQKFPVGGVVATELFEIKIDPNAVRSDAPAVDIVYYDPTKIDRLSIPGFAIGLATGLGHFTVKGNASLRGILRGTPKLDAKASLPLGNLHFGDASFEVSTTGGKVVLETSRLNLKTLDAKKVQVRVTLPKKVLIRKEDADGNVIEGTLTTDSVITADGDIPNKRFHIHGEPDLKLKGDLTLTRMDPETKVRQVGTIHVDKTVQYTVTPSLDAQGLFHLKIELPHLELAGEVRSPVGVTPEFLIPQGSTVSLNIDGFAGELKIDPRKVHDLKKIPDLDFPWTLPRVGLKVHVLDPKLSQLDPGAPDGDVDLVVDANPHGQIMLTKVQNGHSTTAAQQPHQPIDLTLTASLGKDVNLTLQVTTKADAVVIQADSTGEWIETTIHDLKIDSTLKGHLKVWDMAAKAEALRTLIRSGEIQARVNRQTGDVRLIVKPKGDSPEAGGEIPKTPGTVAEWRQMSPADWDQRAAAMRQQATVIQSDELTRDGKLAEAYPKGKGDVFIFLTPLDVTFNLKNPKTASDALNQLMANVTVTREFPNPPTSSGGSESVFYNQRDRSLYIVNPDDKRLMLLLQDTFGLKTAEEARALAREGQIPLERLAGLPFFEGHYQDPETRTQVVEGLVGHYFGGANEIGTDQTHRFFHLLADLQKESKALDRGRVFSRHLGEKGYHRHAANFEDDGVHMVTLGMMKGSQIMGVVRDAARWEKWDQRVAFVKQEGDSLNGLLRGFNGPTHPFRVKTRHQAVGPVESYSFNQGQRPADKAAANAFAGRIIVLPPDDNGRRLVIDENIIDLPGDDRPHYKKTGDSLSAVDTVKAHAKQTAAALTELSALAGARQTFGTLPVASTLRNDQEFGRQAKRVGELTEFLKEGGMVVDDKISNKKTVGAYLYKPGITWDQFKAQIIPHFPHRYLGNVEVSYSFPAAGEANTFYLVTVVSAAGHWPALTKLTFTQEKGEYWARWELVPQKEAAGIIRAHIPELKQAMADARLDHSNEEVQDYLDNKIISELDGVTHVRGSHRYNPTTGLYHYSQALKNTAPYISFVVDGPIITSAVKTAYHIVGMYTDPDINKERYQEKRKVLGNGEDLDLMDPKWTLP